MQDGGQCRLTRSLLPWLLLTHQLFRDCQRRHTLQWAGRQAWIAWKYSCRGQPRAVTLNAVRALTCKDYIVRMAEMSGTRKLTSSRRRNAASPRSIRTNGELATTFQASILARVCTGDAPLGKTLRKAVVRLLLASHLRLLWASACRLHGPMQDYQRSRVSSVAISQARILSSRGVQFRSR